jgi:cytochrome c oxidase assembly protein subunit 11
MVGEGRGGGSGGFGNTVPRGTTPTQETRPLPSPQGGGEKTRRGANTAARRRDIVVAAACGVFVAFMVGAAYAAVPFYTWFCKTTGFGGVPQIAKVGPTQVSDRTITVRFDANVGAGLPWRFEPERTSIEVRLGEVVTVYYTVTNLSARDTAGQAAYNVAPTTVGGYFDKINCFCFTEQHLAPGEKREMAVVFYVDPVLIQDSDQDDLNTITLSYTFFPLRPPRAGVAAGAAAARAGSKI